MKIIVGSIKLIWTTIIRLSSVVANTNCNCLALQKRYLWNGVEIFGLSYKGRLLQLLVVIGILCLSGVCSCMDRRNLYTTTTMWSKDIREVFQFDKYDRFDCEDITLLNIGTTQDSTNPPWIPWCIYDTTKCQCLAKLCPYILYIKGATCEHSGPLISTHDLSIPMVNFTFAHNIYICQAIETI